MNAEKSNSRFPRRTGSPPPPEAAARKRNMDSDFGSEYESEDEPGRDKSLEDAQNGVPFGKKRPKFNELKSAGEGKEEEKEEG